MAAETAVAELIPGVASVIALRFPTSLASRLGEVSARRRRDRAVTDVLVASGIPASAEARSWLHRTFRAAELAGPAGAWAAMAQIEPARPIVDDARALAAAREQVLAAARLAA